MLGGCQLVRLSYGMLNQNNGHRERNRSKARWWKVWNATVRNLNLIVIGII